jgi:hypothetical protein
MSNLRPRQLPLFRWNLADGILQPHYSGFQSIVQGAWADYKNLPDKDRAQFSPTARANCVHSFMVFRARAYFMRIPKAYETASFGQILFGINGQVLIRFKKLKKNRMPSNYPTTHAVDFAAQLNLPGIEPAARVTVGYILNKNQTEIIAILVTYIVGKTIVWTIDIDEPGSQVNVVPYPTRTLNRPRVRAKNVKKKKKNDEK